MSDCFGYADDYKVVGRNNISIQINGAKIWKWCTDKLMKFNVSKCNVLCMKGERKATINRWELEKSEKENDLGNMIHKGLSWTGNANCRCEKALKIFFTIKRNVRRGTTRQAKKNLYRSYIVPIISNATVPWKPNQQELKEVEEIQMTATKCILSSVQLTYKDRLRKLDILPLSLYHELHRLLLFLDIVSGRYKIKWQSFIQVTKQHDQNTRTGNTRRFKDQ